MKHGIFCTFLLSFLVGVYVNNVVEKEVLSYILLLFILCLLTVISFYFRQYRQLISPFIIGVFIWIHLSIWTQNFTDENLTRLDPFLFSPQKIEVTITDIHKKTSFSTDYIGRVEHLWNTSLHDRLIHTIVRIPWNFSLDPWDSIEYSSRLYMIENFDGFEYKKFMLSQDIYFRSYGSTFLKNSTSNIHPLFLYISQKRNDLLSVLEKLYPPEEKIFLAWILLGAREDIPQELRENFNKSWLTHFIAVSGFNITILVIFFGFLFQYFPLYLRTFLVVASIILFTILVWFSAPVVRAAIMWGIAYIILSMWRSSSNLTLVLLTACIMVWVSPLSLNYDVSLHLSFLAVIGIVYTQWFFKKIFSFLPSILAIREAFVLTLSALSFTLPIMIFNFGQISLFSPIANIAVAWTIPLAMLLGFLSIIGYSISTSLWYFLAFLDWLLLKYDILMVYFFGNLDFAILQLDFGEYGIYFQTIYFMILIFFITVFSIRTKPSLS